MASGYQGHAVLVDGEGNVVDLVIASLTGDGRSWGGHVQAASFDRPEWTGVTQIRLEDGTEGEINMEEEASTMDPRPVHEGTLRTATVAGSGPPPF